MAASLWADVLNVESIGRNSDFFALGGNSCSPCRPPSVQQGVFLADIFALRTLDRLANAQASTTDNVLQALTPEKRESVLVCFSYAGGNAVNFQMANALYRLTQTTVYGVEPPGNDLSRREGALRCPNWSAEVSRRCSNAVLRESAYGGTARGLGPARNSFAAPQFGIGVDQLVVSGKLLRPIEVLERQMEETRQMTDAEIVHWLESVTGLALDMKGQAEVTPRLAAAYRNDAIGGNVSLKKVWQERVSDSDAAPLPVLCLLADDDPLTQDWQNIVENWKQVSPQLSVERLAEGALFYKDAG